MQSLNIVLLQSDPGAARSLASALSNSFSSVQEVHSLADLRTHIARHRVGVVILDMETVSLPEVKQLTREFPHACVVCTHRLADEEMWTAALDAGAADVCPPSDTSGIVRTALHSVARTHVAAA
jgi:DNA-binding NarL/FixJ family response regulator